MNPFIIKKITIIVLFLFSLNLFNPLKKKRKKNAYKIKYFTIFFDFKSNHMIQLNDDEYTSIKYNLLTNQFFLNQL